MPKLTTAAPKYQKHRASGQAIVTLDGRDYYLGPHGSKTSIAEYDRLVGEWLQNGRRTPHLEVPDLLVDELIDQYWQYVKAKHGTKEHADKIRRALGRMQPLYGHTIAADFGPLALEVVKKKLIEAELARATANEQLGFIKGMFKWAVSRQLLPVTIHQALATVDGVARGEAVHDEKIIEPAPIEHVMAVEPFVSRQVWAMIRLQIITGARPDEICSIRPADIDKVEPDLWLYRPRRHKNKHRGKTRIIAIWTEAQCVLMPFLKRDDEAFCFSPAEAEGERRAKRHRERTTPLKYGNRPGTNRRRKPKRKPRDRYDVDGYRRAISRACERAFMPDPPLGRLKGESAKAWKERLTVDQREKIKVHQQTYHWHPHQLRHEFGTDAWKQTENLEDVQILMGHSDQRTTARYAKRDERRVLQAARRLALKMSG